MQHRITIVGYDVAAKVILECEGNRRDVCQPVDKPGLAFAVITDGFGRQEAIGKGAATFIAVCVAHADWRLASPWIGSRKPAREASQQLTGGSLSVRREATHWPDASARRAGRPQARRALLRAPGKVCTGSPPLGGAVRALACRRSEAKCSLVLPVLLATIQGPSGAREWLLQVARPAARHSRPCRGPHKRVPGSIATVHQYVFERTIGQVTMDAYN